MSDRKHSPFLSAGPLHRLFRRAAGSRCLPIGFYLGQYELSVAQAVRESGGLRWSALLSRKYPCPQTELLGNPKLFRAFVRQTLDEAGCSGRTVVSALPLEDIRILSTQYAVQPGQNEVQCLLRHVEERMQDDLAHSVIDWLPIREAHDKSGDTKSALVAVARRDTVTHYLDRLTSAGLNPLALDIGPAALARLLRITAPEGSIHNVLLINFGRETSFLTVLWGRRLMLDRGVPFGDAEVVRSIAAAFEIAEDAAIVLLKRYGIRAEDEMGATIGDIASTLFADLLREISRVLVYFASQTHGGAINEIRVLGMLSECPGIVEMLTSRLDIPVFPLDPTTLLTGRLPPPARRSPQVGRSGLAVAAGLALPERD